MVKNIKIANKIKYVVCICICTTVMTMCTGYAQMNLTDVDTHWSKQYVEYLVSKGAINGYPDGTFKPDNTVTYGEAIKLIVTSYENNIENGNEHWASNYVEYAQEKGLIPNGINLDKKVDKKISRKEVIYMVKESLTQLASKPVIENERYEMEKPFEDVSVLINTNGVKYSEAIKQCYNLGIVIGNENGLFNPEQEITRAEMVTILARAYSEEYRYYPVIEATNDLPTNEAEYNMILAYMPNSFYEEGSTTFAKYIKGGAPVDYLTYNKDITEIAMSVSREKAETIANAMFNVSYDMSEVQWNMWKKKVLLFEGITQTQIEAYIQYVKDNMIAIKGGVLINPCTIGEIYISKNKTSLGMKGLVDYEIVSNPNNVKYITFSEYITKIKGTYEVENPKYIVIFMKEDETQFDNVKVLHYLKYDVDCIKILN